ncbi:hypothetical protein ACP70R_026811 [Stipagrostis hirtigluma subsp. patula]
MDDNACNMTRWVDPEHHYYIQEYINYLHDRIFDLEREIQAADAQLCSNPKCRCPCHSNYSSPPPSPSVGGHPPPPAPPPPTGATGPYGGNYWQSGPSTWYN